MYFFVFLACFGPGRPQCLSVPPAQTSKSGIVAAGGMFKGRRLRGRNVVPASPHWPRNYPAATSDGQNGKKGGGGGGNKSK